MSNETPTAWRSAFRLYAPGWNSKRLEQRVQDIRRHHQSNLDNIPLPKRREIARIAKTLLASLEGLGGLDSAFSQTLGDLAAQPGDGRSLKGNLAAMIVRLYIEAHAKPAYSDGGPLVRFAMEVFKFLEVPRKDRPSSQTLKAEFNKLKAELMADKTRVLVRSKFDPSIKLFGSRIWPEGNP